MAMVVAHTDFPGDPPDARDAACAIERLEERRADAAGCGAVLACALAAAVAIAPELAAALLAGVVAAAVIAAAAQVSLGDLLDRCALFPTTSTLPGVARRQRRLAAPRSRRALAADLRHLAEHGSDAHVPGRPVILELVLFDRARAVRGQLVELAALVEQLERPDPIALARLRWLLRDGFASPLYNPAVTAEELGVILHHARLRLTLSEPDRGRRDEAPGPRT